MMLNFPHAVSSAPRSQEVAVFSYLLKDTGISVLSDLPPTSAFCSTSTTPRSHPRVHVSYSRVSGKNPEAGLPLWGCWERVLWVFGLRFSALSSLQRKGLWEKGGGSRGGKMPRSAPRCWDVWKRLLSEVWIQSCGGPPPRAMELQAFCRLSVRATVPCLFLTVT